MSYVPELDDRRQEVRRAANQRVVLWPKVAGVGNVFVDQAEFSIRTPAGVELAAGSATLTEFGDTGEEVHRLSCSFDASALDLAENYQVVFVYEYDSEEHQETVRFDVVYEPWSGSDISLNDLRDEVADIGEVLGGLARVKGTERTAEQEAAIYAVKACTEVKGWIRQQLTALGRIYPRLILQREELRGVVAAQAVARIYKAGGGTGTGRYADLANQWADEARRRLTALGELPYDSDEDSVEDTVVGGFTSVTLRRGGPRAPVTPTSNPASVPSLTLGGGGGGGASGDVVGPASATDNALARFDLATGKLIQSSVGILSDAGDLTGVTIEGVDVSDLEARVDTLESSGGVSEGAVRTALAASTGAIDLNAQNITDVGTVDGRDVGADGTALDAHLVASAPHSGHALTGTTISAGTGLTGGGDLSANRTLSVAYGTTAGTATEGNDSRVVNAVQTSRTISAGTGLTGGGDLSANRTLSANVGTGSGTLAAGDDSRITGAIQSSVLTTNGDILVRSGGSPSRLGLGNDGQGPRNIAGSLVNAYVFEPRREVVVYDDFVTAIAGSGFTFSNFVLVVVNTDANHCGLVRWVSNSVTTGSISTNVGGIQLDGGEIYFETCVQMQLLSDATDTYSFTCGFGDLTTAGAHTDEVGFRYSHSINGGKFLAVCRSNSVETGSTLDTGITVAAGTWYRLGLRVNAAATSVEFFIDGVSVGSITSNIPTGASRVVGLVLKVDRTAGTGNIAHYVDYVFFRKAVNR